MIVGEGLDDGTDLAAHESLVRPIRGERHNIKQFDGFVHRRALHHVGGSKAGGTSLRTIQAVRTQARPAGPWIRYSITNRCPWASSVAAVASPWIAASSSRCLSSSALSALNPQAAWMVGIEAIVAKFLQFNDSILGVGELHARCWNWEKRSVDSGFWIGEARGRARLLPSRGARRRTAQRTSASSVEPELRPPIPMAHGLQYLADPPLSRLPIARPKSSVILTRPKRGMRLFRSPFASHRRKMGCGREIFS